jgi:hypothetical protein
VYYTGSCYPIILIQFPKRVIEEAKGNIEQLTYLLTDESQKERTPDFINTNAPVRFISCKIPASEQAIEIIKEEMQKFGSLAWANENSNDVNDNFNTTSSTQNGGEWVEKCTYTPTGASVTLNPGKPDEVTIYFFNKECEMIYVHGGDSGGSTGGDVGCDVGGLGGIDNEVMNIIVDDSILQNDLTDCVYGKLNSSQIFLDLIENFEDGNSTFDLIFELGETENNTYGELFGSPPNDFVIRIDASWVTIRNGLEVAGTFLHEVMHAEMRRYLYDQQQNGSTIPGFPGSFTEDWNNYVEQKTGGVGAAEHEAIAEYFIGFLADGLQEYDNSQLNRAYYEAVAWDGLLNTDAWENADQNQIGQFRNDDAIDDRPQQCSR